MAKKKTARTKKTKSPMKRKKAATALPPPAGPVFPVALRQLKSRNLGKRDFLIMFQKRKGREGAAPTETGTREPSAPERVRLARASQKTGPPPREDAARGGGNRKPDGPDKAARLERELSSTREQLRALIAEHETAQEEMKAANEEILSSKEELRGANEELETVTAALFDGAAQGILGVNAGGVIQLVNRAAAQIFGYERSELLGQRIEILLPEPRRKRHLARRRSFMSAPETRPMDAGLDLYGRRKDASQFPVEIGLSHVKTRLGPLAVAFVSDLTERKKAERELQELAGLLINAQEDERRRIALDLHGDIMQDLAILSMEIGRLVIDLAAAGETKERLRALQDRVYEISNEIRDISHRLHPSIVGDLGLTSALKALLEEFSDARRIPVEFAADADCGELSIENSSCLYRIAQECLQNVAKHAKATEVRVTLRSAGGNAELTVSDNGVGFQAGRDRPGTGIGLLSMKERVRAVNGTISIRSEPGKGTEIDVSVPMK